MSAVRSNFLFSRCGLFVWTLDLDSNQFREPKLQNIENPVLGILNFVPSKQAAVKKQARNGLLGRPRDSSRMSQNMVISLSPNSS